MKRDDDYQRWVDLKFQEITDREANEREQELLASLRSVGASDKLIEETRGAARKLAVSVGKTEAEAHIWADEILREGVRRRLLNKRLEPKDSH